MQGLKTLSSLLQTAGSVEGKVVLLRADLNVPMHHGKVVDNTRIVRTLPTIQALQKAGAKVVVMSHFGRPKGQFCPESSLSPIADALGEALNEDVFFAVDCVGKAAEKAIASLKNGQVVLLENLRFYEGETNNDAEFAKQLAANGDVFVNDAFSCSHRAHASIEGVTHYIDSYAGLLLEEEVKHLHAALDGAKRPVAAIVGGSKVSTKIALLEQLVKKTDYLLVGGGMANTFLFAQGHDVGLSLCEKDKVELAKTIMKAAEDANCKLVVPSDAVVAEKLEEGQRTHIVSTKNVPEDLMMLDIGPETVEEWTNILKQCKTAVWNGPLGAYEIMPFHVSSVQLARVVASQTQKGELVSVAGGGDVLATLGQAGLRRSFSYISTAGGAFLEWLEGKELPGVKALMNLKQAA